MQLVAMSTDFFFLHVVLVVGFLTFYRCHILVLVFDPCLVMVLFSLQRCSFSYFNKRKSCSCCKILVLSDNMVANLISLISIKCCAFHLEDNQWLAKFLNNYDDDNNM